MSDNRLYEKGIKYAHLNSADTYVLRSGQARLLRVSVSLTAAGTATIYNNSEASGEVVSIIDSSIKGTLEFGGIFLGTGLTIVTDNASSMTVVYE